MIIAAAAAVVIGGTAAYFSDTETSTGNTFTAGAIDLEISSHYSDYSGEYGFEAKNLDGETLFVFEDMKPGDMGGGYFDVTADSNPYWACIKSEVETQPENNVLESETGDTLDNGDQDGELQNYLTLYFWNDLNADGEYTVNDITQDRNLNGPFTLAQLEAIGYLPLADATGVPGPSFFSGSPLNPNQEYNLGYKFCFGTWGIDPETNGLSCTGEGDQNIAQTDGVTGSMEFYAVQARNNMEFVCSSMNEGVETVVLNNPEDHDTIQDLDLAKIGASSWKNDDDSNDKTELYVYASSLPGALGTFTIDDIKEISYSTNKPGLQGDVDFYYTVYTETDSIDDTASWYGYRLNMEPYYSNSLNAPANVWNTWSTDVGTNESTFFDTAKTAGGYGFYGQPSLSDLQAGNINWSTYNASYSNQNIDYGAEYVKYISFQTGSAWDELFTGSIDEIVIELMNGNKLTIDLE